MYQCDVCLTGCPRGSTEASLEIIAFSEEINTRLELHVVEPGGVEVAGEYGFAKLGVSTPIFEWGTEFGAFKVFFKPRKQHKTDENKKLNDNFNSYCN